MKLPEAQLLAVFLMLSLGVASAAVLITLNIPGNVTVQNPGLVATPSSLDWGTVTVNATHGASVSRSLSLQNTGQVPLSLGFSCQCQGMTAMFLPGLGVLNPGESWTGTVTLMVPAGFSPGQYAPQLIITGSSG